MKEERKARAASSPAPETAGFEKAVAKAESAARKLGESMKRHGFSETLSTMLREAEETLAAARAALDAAKAAAPAVPTLVVTREHVEALWQNLDLLLKGMGELDPLETRTTLPGLFERVTLTPRETRNGVAWQLATGLKLNAPRALRTKGAKFLTR
jgi:hypothetical protein